MIKKKHKYLFFPFPLDFLDFFPFFPPFCPLFASSTSLAPSSLSLVAVLFRLLTDSSALDCCRFRLVDLGLGATASTPALQLAARSSLALFGTGSEGGDEDMVVVRKKEGVTWHLGHRVYGFSRKSKYRHQGIASSNLT